MDTNWTYFWWVAGGIAGLYLLLLGVVGWSCREWLGELARARRGYHPAEEAAIKRARERAEL
jgi:hypothetical protein